jgi:phospholipid/cholesterol/gamma-HCH transport system substrate-binding protein
MSRSVLETIMGAAVLGVAGFFLVTTYQSSGMSVAKDSYQVKAQFSDVTGIGIGSDVRIGGVKIGTVQSITLDHRNYQAELAMSVAKDLSLPVDTTATIVGESLLGGKFVALAPGGDTEMLGPGGMIEFTQSSVSLEQLLGKFVFSGGGVDSGDNEKPEQTPPVADGSNAIDLTLP